MTRTAVLTYPHSHNLGDPIQQIAAELWINGANVKTLDRETLHQYKGSKVKLLMNGWFMEHPENWPPSDKIQPFFISFHLNPTAEKQMLTTEGVAYLKKHEPIGCRDLHTQMRLERHGISTYYSACLTLTLNRKHFVSSGTKRSGILVISPFERLLPNEKDTGLSKSTLMNKFINAIKRPLKQKNYNQAKAHLDTYLSKQKEKVMWMSQLMDATENTEEERKNAAEQQLVAIAKASLLITSRIHSALPAVAFGTPVLFLSDGLEHTNQKSRLEGLEMFFPMVKAKDLKNWIGKKVLSSKQHYSFLKRFEVERENFLKIP